MYAHRMKIIKPWIVLLFACASVCTSHVVHKNEETHSNCIEMEEKTESVKQRRILHFPDDENESQSECPGKCGGDTDVKCLFNPETKKAECKCDSADKLFDEKIKKCRVPCRSKSDCVDAWCIKKSEADPFGFCSCDWGKDGDRCEESIDECKKAGIDCGEDRNVTCSYTTRGILYPKESYCKCPLWYYGYDYDAKVCKACDCGLKTSCTFHPDGIKTCHCDAKHYESGGKCLRCNCGDEAAYCELENGKKVCVCVSMYQDNGYGVCLECNCGPHADCFFDKGTKICTCKNGYIKAPDGICRERCSEESPCSNGGRCVNNLCQCLPGTKGGKCEVVEPCTATYKTWEMCGAIYGVECAFNQTTRTPYCVCTVGNKSYDAQRKECRERCGGDKYCSNGAKCVKNVCQCLPGTRGDYCELVEPCETQWSTRRECSDFDAYCAYNQTTHRHYCTCKDTAYSYDQRYKKCKECKCGQYTYGCRFRSDGKKECNCADGYAQNESGECHECHCGEYGKCHYKGAVKVCDCDQGFIEQNGICKACDCGLFGKCSLVSNNKICECDNGYAIDPFVSDNPDKCKPCECYLGSENMNCTFHHMGRECFCPPGYETSGIYCKDINECLVGNDCPDMTICENEFGSYKCSCKEGFRSYAGKDPKYFGCQDINECDEEDPCHSSGSTYCVNTVGSYRCECHAGYVPASDSQRVVKCVENKTKWIVGYTVLGIVVAMCVFGLIFGLTLKYRRSRILSRNKKNRRG